MNLGYWAYGAWADGSWVPESWGGGGDGAQGGEEPSPILVPAQGTVDGGGSAYDSGHSRSRKEISEARKRLGLEDAYEKEQAARAAAIIKDVAARQAETLERDEQKRFEELTRQLALERIEFRAAHLESLNRERERLIDLEIAKLLRKKLEDEEMLLVLLMVAAVAA